MAAPTRVPDDAREALIDALCDQDTALGIMQELAEKFPDDADTWRTVEANTRAAADASFVIAVKTDTPEMYATAQRAGVLHDYAVNRLGLIAAKRLAAQDASQVNLPRWFSTGARVNIEDAGACRYVAKDTVDRGRE